MLPSIQLPTRPLLCPRMAPLLPTIPLLSSTMCASVSRPHRFGLASLPTRRPPMAMMPRQMELSSQSLPSTRPSSCCSLKAHAHWSVEAAALLG